LATSSPFPLLSTRGKREDEDEEELVHNEEQLELSAIPSVVVGSIFSFSLFVLLSTRRKEKTDKEMKLCTSTRS